MTRLFFCLILALAQTALAAAETWPAALARMPLPTNVTQLNRTNCVELMLRAFQSNDVVKALIFMPGATDELYLFRRASASLTNPFPTLLDAVCALTNQTLIRVTFRPPLLLLHSDQDPLEPDVTIQHPPTLERLKQVRVAPYIYSNDRDWDFLQPLLKKSLKIDLRPWRYSRDSWHFYRHSFAAWHLTGWEALETAALAGKSKFTIRRNQAIFQEDPRFLPSP